MLVPGRGIKKVPWRGEGIIALMAAARTPSYHCAFRIHHVDESDRLDNFSLLIFHFLLLQGFSILFFFLGSKGLQGKRKGSWDFLGILKIFVHQCGSEWLQFKCGDTANVTKKEISGKLDSWKIRVGKVIKMRIRLEKECKILDVRAECLGRVERHRELRDF